MHTVFISRSDPCASVLELSSRFVRINPFLEMPSNCINTLSFEKFAVGMYSEHKPVVEQVKPPIILEIFTHFLAKNFQEVRLILVAGVGASVDVEPPEFLLRGFHLEEDVSYRAGGGDGLIVDFFGVCE
jgi:hypothetical protein